MQVFVKCRVVHNNLHCKPSKMMLWLPMYGRLVGRLVRRLSLGPGQWLWLLKRSGQGQSQPRPTFWLGLAWPDFGLAWLGFWLQAKASTALLPAWCSSINPRFISFQLAPFSIPLSLAPTTLGKSSKESLLFSSPTSPHRPKSGIRRNLLTVRNWVVGSFMRSD